MLSPRVLVALLCADVILIAALSIPEILSFNFWMFSDQGANLIVQFLAAQGLRPALDFGYNYGVLPLMIGRLWFAIFGATPTSCAAALLLCGVAAAWGLARFASSLRLGWAGILLLVIAMPFAVPPGYPSIAHALEAALLCNGLAEQAAGKRERALALATAACFAKAGMGYVYGFILLLFIVTDLRRREVSLARGLWRAAIPSIVTAALLALILSALSGPAAVLHTLLPISGMREYRALNFGFFRDGRNFWHPPGVRIGYYAGTVAGFWIVASLWLFTCGLRSALASLHGALHRVAGILSDEMIITCALLHAAFIGLLFGNSFSWFYYSYILVMGVAATTALGSFATAAVWGLAVIAIVGLKTTAISGYRQWKTTRPAAETAGLWATNDEREEWTHVMGLVSAAAAQGHRAVMLEQAGCPDLTFDGFAPPVTAYLWPGIATPGDMQRKIAQLDSATMVVLPVMKPLYQDFPGEFPEFVRVLDDRFVPLWTGSYFAIYVTRSPSLPPG